MKVKSTEGDRRNKNVIRYIVGTALVLLVPLVAMLFTDEVRWDWFDFAAIGTLLLGSGLLYELITSRANARYRPIIAVLLGAVVLVIWIELAVGIIGSPFAGN